MRPRADDIRPFGVQVEFIATLSLWVSGKAHAGGIVLSQLFSTYMLIIRRAFTHFWGNLKKFFDLGYYFYVQHKSRQFRLPALVL